MTNPNDDLEKPSVNADHNSNAVGSISAGGDISGNIHIGNIGYTTEQVSVLIAQIQSTFQPKPFDGRSPYKGLDVFEEEDAELFFGREKLVDDLVSRVKESRTVFVTGPSGSGKSSLVRAGLIHALKQGAIKGSDRWLYATMKPGRDPIGELGRVVSSLASSTNPEDEIRAKAMKDSTIFARWCEITLKEGRDKRLVLFIDQFEEVFTQISNEEERVAFLNLLTHAATIGNGRVIILFSMRSDFVSNCATYPQLNELLNEQFKQIGAMQPEELVSAIAQPALRVGLRIDPDLIAQIINEMKGEPGALPLMQFALKDLFDSQQEKSGVIALTLNDYLQRGGIHKALERHADDSFSKLSKSEQELAHSIFSRLIEIGRGTQDTKRTALFEELVPANAKAEEIEAVVQKLADARLITTDEAAGKDTVTISHEKLIDAWPWLKKLVNENRDVIALQNQITADAKEWEEHKRDASYLYAGGRLANVHEQVEKQKLTFNQLAQEFVRAGRTRQRRGQALLVSAVSIVLIAAIVASIIFQNQAQANIEIANTAQANETEALRQTQLAKSGEVASQAQALHNNELQFSMLLAIEAYNIADTKLTRSTLLSNTQNPSEMIGFLGNQRGDVDGPKIAISPNGKIIATGGENHSIALWDIETRELIGKLKANSNWILGSLVFSPDSAILASAGQNGEITIWDTETQAIDTVIHSNIPIINNLIFSPDGKFLVATGNGLNISIWDAKTFSLVKLLPSDNFTYESDIGFSPNGNILVSTAATCVSQPLTTCKSRVVMWDAQNDFKYIADLPSQILQLTTVRFNPNGKFIAAGGINGVEVWNISTLPYTSTILYQNNVNSLAFHPDPETDLLVVGGDSIEFWDIYFSRKTRYPLTGHSSTINSIEFSPNGDKLFSGSCNFNATTHYELCDKGEVIIWNTEDLNPIASILNTELPKETNVVTVSSSGDYAILRKDDKYILWDIISHTQTGQLKNCPDSIVSPKITKNKGYFLEVCNATNKAYLWNTSSFQLLSEIPVNDAIRSAISLNGKLIAIEEKSQITLWDVSLRKTTKILFYTEGFGDLIFSPDGTLLAASSCNNKDNLNSYCEPKISIWEVETMKLVAELVVHGAEGFIHSIVFSPDGNVLVSGGGGNGVQGGDSSIIFWDIKTGQQIGLPLKPNKGIIFEVTSLSFSPDGSILASGDEAGGIILWDTTTKQVLNQFRGTVGFQVGYADTNNLIINNYGTIELWSLDPSSLINILCQRAGRNFTHEEWLQYFPTETYRATCPKFPLETVETSTVQP